MSKSIAALRSITSSVALSLTLFGVGFIQPAMAQTRSLPKANFSNYSGNSNALPNAGGLSLQEGQDRPRGAPPEVYNPGEPSLQHKLVRWESRFMPLRVWISPGKKLSDKPISQINQSRPQEVLGLMKSDPGFSSLQQCAGWTPAMSSAAQVGIEQWKEFQNEGLFAFDFVDDPTQANILLFWSDGFTGDEGVGGVSTGGNTVAVLYDANEVRAKEAANGGLPLQGTPVIIELRADESFDKLQGRAAHEFGHALGIKEHSPYNQDLMCVNGIVHQLSASDKATIRWLYRQRTPLVMLPPVIARGGGSYGQTQQPQQHTGSTQSAGGGGWVDRAPGAQTSSGNQQSGGGQSYTQQAPEGAEDYQSNRRPAGYRIPVSRPVKRDDSYEDEQPSRPAVRSERREASYDSENKERERNLTRDRDRDKERVDKDRERENKAAEREKKNKKKNDDAASASSSPAGGEYQTPPAPKDKASDGY